MQAEKQAYELTFILGEKATPEDGTSKTKTVTALIKKLGGEVTKEEHWGRRELAYEIKRNRSGFYVTLWFDFPTQQINALERELNFDVDIIRFLTTRAYTTAQPGTLYPVAEEEKTEKAPRGGRTEKTEEQGSAEEMLRRSSAAKAESKTEDSEEDSMPEEDRLEKLDEALETLLKEEE